MTWGVYGVLITFESKVESLGGEIPHHVHHISSPEGQEAYTKVCMSVQQFVSPLAQWIRIHRYSMAFWIRTYP